MKKSPCPPSLCSSSIRSLRHLLVAGLATFALHSASAVDGSWVSTASGTQSWNVGTNWSSDPAIPDGANAVVEIETNITSSTSIDFSGTSRTVGTLSIGDASGSSKFSIVGTGGESLTFDQTGGAQLTFHGGSNEISTEVILNSNLAITANPSPTRLQAFSGTVSGTGGITQSGIGKVYLSGINTFTGGYTLNEGELTAGTNSSLAEGVVTLNGGTLHFGANLVLSNSINLGGNVIMSGNGVANRTGTLNGPVTLADNSQVTTANGMEAVTINGNVDGSGNLTISGTGALVLNDADGNTYSGDTLVSAGTLLINNTSGSGTGSGAVTVASGAVLEGDGIISGVTTIAGSLRPGNSLTNLTVANDLTWDAGDAWVFGLGTAAASLLSASSGGSTQDQLLLTGAGSDFIKGSGSDWTFDFDGGGETGWYRLITWTGTTAFVDGDFLATNLGAGLSGSFVVDPGTTSALYLNVVVPEPSTSVLLVAGLSLLMIFSRRRHAVQTVRI